MVFDDDKLRKERAEKKELYSKDGKSVVTGANFGDIVIAGKLHVEAAEWLKNTLAGVGKAAEIKARSQCEQMFDVVVFTE